MRPKLICALIAATLFVASSATATSAPRFLSHYTFTSGTQGWTAEGTGGSLQVVAGPSGEGPGLKVTASSNTFLARSPEVPADAGRYVWHFVTTGAGMTAIVMGARGPSGEKVFDVTASSGSLMTGPLSVNRFRTPPGTSWHRLDVVPVGSNYAVTLDQTETLTVVPTNAVPIKSFVAAPRSGTLVIDNLTVWASGSPLETSFINDDPRFVFSSTDTRGIARRDVGSILDNGSAYIEGNPEPLSRHQLAWSIADLGPRWETTLCFRNLNSVLWPDHMAVLAGLDDSGVPLWAFTLAPGVVPNSTQDLMLYYLDGQGGSTPLLGGMYVLGHDELEVVADTSTSTIGLRVSQRLVTTITGVQLASTKSLAVGDVFGGIGTYVATGLTVLGPTGWGMMEFDNIETAPLG